MENQFAILHMRTSMILRALTLAVFVVSMPLSAIEVTPEQDAFDRIQEEQRRREQRRLDDAFVPGRRAPRELPAIEPGGPCIALNDLRFDALNGDIAPLTRLLAPIRQRYLGRCLDAAGMQALHRDLSAALTESGFVTSRLLINEQQPSEGVLVLSVLAGRIEKVTPEGVSPRLVRFALPVRAGRLLNLRDLEQAIENLARVQGLEAAFDIRPGSDNGESELVIQGNQGSRFAHALIVNERYLDDSLHGSVLWNTTIGSPLGLTDRVILSANSDLDREISDRAWGVGLDYDLGFRYWTLALGYSRQAYLNRLAGVFQTFDASGDTDTTRFELGRLLHRSHFTRLSASLISSYSDVLNELQDAPIQVSTYQLASYGARVDATHLWQRWQFGGGLTLEWSDAHGPASNLPGGGSIADNHSRRLQYNLSLLYGFNWRNGALRWRLDGQHASDSLFPLQRFSLASRIRGFDDTSVTGNSGHSSSLEYSLTTLAGAQSSWRTSLAFDAGVIPGNSNESESEQLYALTLGNELRYRQWQLALEASAPLQGASSRDALADAVVRAKLIVTL